LVGAEELEETVRKLLGFACHKASVRLHEVAVRLLEWEDDYHAEPTIWWDGCSADGLRREYPPLELYDVAPRLADALDMVRANYWLASSVAFCVAQGKLEHVRWLAGGGGMGR
jgi:hypothetical protein